MKAYVVRYGDGLLATLEDGRQFACADPGELADTLFAAGVSQGDVSMPDWRAGDIAPHGGIRIALHARLAERSSGTCGLPKPAN
ncbi:hypothetical protein [Cupriavidus necator]